MISDIWISSSGLSRWKFEEASRHVCISVPVPDRNCYLPFITLILTDRVGQIISYYPGTDSRSHGKTSQLITKNFAFIQMQAHN
jgi:hypothetical protein